MSLKVGCALHWRRPTQGIYTLWPSAFASLYVGTNKESSEGRYQTLSSRALQALEGRHSKLSSPVLSKVEQCRMVKM